MHESCILSVIEEVAMLLTSLAFSAHINYTTSYLKKFNGDVKRLNNVGNMQKHKLKTCTC